MGWETAAERNCEASCSGMPGRIGTMTVRARERGRETPHLTDIRLIIGILRCVTSDGKRSHTSPRFLRVPTMSDAAGDGKPKKKARWRNRSAWTVFLTNLDYSSDAAAVREFVEELKVLSGSAPAVAPADLVDVRLAADKGRSKGIGFVELATDEACARLIAAFGDKGVEMEGRVLKASMCDPAKEKKQRKDKATAAAAAGAGGDEPTKKRRRTRDGDDADAAAAKKPHREPREPH